MPTFTHGKATRAYMNALDMSAYLRKIDHAAEVDVAETSTFSSGDDKTYIPGMVGASLSAEGLFDAGLDAVLDAVTGSATPQVWQHYPVGDTLGNPGRGVYGNLTSNTKSSEIGDVVTVSVEVQPIAGPDPILSHHAHAERSAAGTATRIDGAAATSLGGVAYLNVTAIAGSVAIVVQDSADDVTYTTIANFGTVSATGGSRVAVSGTVRRYTRVVYTPSPSATVSFVAGFGRNPY